MESSNSSILSSPSASKSRLQSSPRSFRLRLSGSVHPQKQIKENHLPVLIIPGIMSSGLVVRKSAVHKRHVGDRVWLNPIALGFGKIKLGESFTTSEKEPPPSTAVAASTSSLSITSSIHQSMGALPLPSGRPTLLQFASSSSTIKPPDSTNRGNQELDCKSAWLQHMSLTSDMCTEREGNEIRPIPGLGGVDFLTELATIKVGASYVFGPVIKLLKSIGYVETVNLDACPYDWRIPPCVLEARDEYFSKTMQRIEKMYADTDGKPVVLLCHSMGCKTGHYLLNFVLEKLGPLAGGAWLDQHIHTYMPLGAPHIGAPSVVGGSFSASLNPILDPMLSLEERLVFARSLGSAGWLMPTMLPSIERNAPPSILCKAEGKLTITILHDDSNPLGDVARLVTNKHGTRRVEPFQIKVAYGDKGSSEKDDRSKQRTGSSRPCAHPRSKHSKSSLTAQYFACTDKFVYPTPPSLTEDDSSSTSMLKPIQFTLCERGSIAPHAIEPTYKVLELARRIPLPSNPATTAYLVHNLAKVVDKYKVPLAVSTPIENINARALVKAGSKGITMTVPLVARVDTTLFGMVPKKKHRSIEMTINIKWEPPVSNADDDPTNLIAMIPHIPRKTFHLMGRISGIPTRTTKPQSLFAPIPSIRSTKTFMSEYVPLSGQAMLRAEGLEETFCALTRDKYHPTRDRIGPRHASSYLRPPVKRIFAIYGVNLETEVSKVCKRVSSYHEDETPHERQARPRFEVDTETTLIGNNESGHKLVDGVLYEHPGTPQIDLVTGKRIYRSGDGSVPYYSLQQSQVWAKEIRTDPRARERGEAIRIKEIEGAEHRAMLSDERFHTLLVDYLTGRTTLG